MTPLVLMRRVIAPQAIRTMVPAFGSEAVSALKNSSLASVIAVEELTLRSTQLASSTFDFFSIFFASGSIYLALTGAVSALQLTIEAMLDLDRPSRATSRRLTALVSAACFGDAQAGRPGGGNFLTVRRASAGIIAAARGRAGRPGQARLVERNNVAVEVRDLCKTIRRPCRSRRTRPHRAVGEVIALLGPSGSGKSTLLRCINLLEGWDTGTVRVAGRRLGYSEDGRKLSARAFAKNVRTKAWAWCFSSSTCSAI